MIKIVAPRMVQAVADRAIQVTFNHWYPNHVYNIIVFREVHLKGKAILYNPIFV